MPSHSQFKKKLSLQSVMKTNVLVKNNYIQSVKIFEKNIKGKGFMNFCDPPNNYPKYATRHSTHGPSPKVLWVPSDNFILMMIVVIVASGGFMGVTWRTPPLELIFIS